MVVTGLYDIGRGNWDSYDLQMDAYLHWMENMLCLNEEIIIFTEPKLYDKIYSIRQKYDNRMTNTTIVVKELEELHYYKHYHESICRTMRSPKYIKFIRGNIAPETTKPLYNVIMYEKVKWLKEASTLKPQQEVFIWLDAGAFRQKQSNNAFDLDKIPKNKITFFVHTEDFTHKDITKEHLVSQARYVHGTCFICPRNLILDFDTHFRSRVKNYLASNITCSDEKILDSISVDPSISVHFIKSDWRQYLNKIGKHV